jgi:hypothetical protein
MPRDGSGHYNLPFANVITNQVISSTVYNGFTNDVATDLNDARPISAGGTGAVTAAAAIVNLGGEVAKQAVTNYDSFTFVNGSFYSLAGATGAPNPTNGFIGIYYENSNGSYATAEARDQVTGINYLRSKVANVWGTWAPDQSASFVELAGDTMTGNLTISKADPKLILNKAASTQTAGITGQMAASARWAVEFGDTTAESGSNAGSNFKFSRYSDAGTFIDSPLTITRSNGNATFGAQAVVNGLVWSITAAGTGTYHFGNSGTKSLAYDGTNYFLTGGPLLVNSSVTSILTSTTGTYLFGSSGTKSLAYDGTNYTLAGGNLAVSSGIGSVLTSTTGVYYFGSGATKNLTYDATNFVFTGGNVHAASGSNIGIGAVATGLYGDGTAVAVRGFGAAGVSLQSASGATTYMTCTASGLTALPGFLSRQGSTDVTPGPNVWNFHWTSTTLELWIDATGLGTVNVTPSDYRIKKDVIDLPGMWDTVKALRPIKYTQAEFSPPSHTAAKPLFTNDSIERWGFFAHDLQEALTPSAATGIKDAPNIIQSPNPFTVIAALTKALQEAMARIEALEARA